MRENDNPFSGHAVRLVKEKEKKKGDVSGITDVDKLAYSYIV